MKKSGTGMSSGYYEIMILGMLNEHWSSWFNGLIIIDEQAGSDPPVSLLRIYALDQARLRGVLNKIWDLNLTLLSVNQIDDPLQTKEENYG